MFKTNNRCTNNRCMDMGGMEQMMNPGMMNPNMMSAPMTLPGMECEPIIECPCERVVNRQICHNVPHIQPMHTRIVNHHIYNHSFIPQYTCCEENLVTHVYDQNPCCK